LGQSVDVACSGFFGDLAACADDCAIGWIRHPFNLSDFDPIGRNSSLRVYTDNQTTSVAAMETSVLYSARS